MLERSRYNILLHRRVLFLFDGIVDQKNCRVLPCRPHLLRLHCPTFLERSHSGLVHALGHRLRRGPAIGGKSTQRRRYRWLESLPLKTCHISSTSYRVRVRNDTISGSPRRSSSVFDIITAEPIGQQRIAVHGN